jgi:tryptophan 2,3-dioxygenase
MSESNCDKPKPSQIDFPTSDQERYIKAKVENQIRVHSDPIDYSKYLRLDMILSAQECQSAKFGAPSHDEMMFICVHQCYEIWFKLVLHELDAVLERFGQPLVSEEAVFHSVSNLSRCCEILDICVSQLSIMESMTPLGFLSFRDFIAPASGFQSTQVSAREVTFVSLVELTIEFLLVPVD